MLWVVVVVLLLLPFSDLPLPLSLLPPRATSWAGLTEFHFRKMNNIFRRLSHVTPPDLSLPTASYAEKEEGVDGGGEGGVGGDEGGVGGEGVREELVRFLTNVGDALGELSDILVSFLLLFYYLFFPFFSFFSFFSLFRFESLFPPALPPSPLGSQCSC